MTYGGNGLRQLWDLVFAENSALVGKGLVALGLQNAVIVWINSKPKALGGIIRKQFNGGILIFQYNTNSEKDCCISNEAYFITRYLGYT